MSELGTFDIANLNVGSGEFVHNLPTAHHHDAVCNANNLIGVCRCHEYRGTIARGIVDQEVDFFFGSYVDPAGWFVEDENAGVKAQTAAKQNLLLIAAAEGTDRNFRACGFDGKAVDPFMGLHHL